MKLLADSDFLVALYKPNDSNYRKATIIYKKIEKQASILATNLVFQESTTVISKKMGMASAREFYGIINKFVSERIVLNENLESASWVIFLKQTKKGTSFVDCANLAVAEKYKLDGILSFDDFYPKELKVS